MKSTILWAVPRIVWYKLDGVSEQFIASIFRDVQEAKKTTIRTNP
jgi:hypothetical protein